MSHDHEATVDERRPGGMFPADDTRELRDTRITTDHHGTHEIRIPVTAKTVAWKHEAHADSGNPEDDSGPVWVDGIPLGVSTTHPWGEGDDLAGTESVRWYTPRAATQQAEILGAVLETQ